MMKQSGASVERSYANIHDLFHDLYVTRGTKFLPHAEYLERGARLVLERTAILPNLPRARLLLDVLDECRPTATGSEGAHERFFGIFRLLMELYESIADDLLVLSAIELHAKAVLLRAGYVIHEIRKPSSLKQVQRSTPVHVRTIRAKLRKGEEVRFSRTTLGIRSLFDDGYIKHYPMTATARAAIADVRRRRNLVHFFEPFAWSIDRGLLELVEHLNFTIPRIDKQMRIRSAPRGA
jgi:hypothetical protein